MGWIYQSPSFHSFHKIDGKTLYFYLVNRICLKNLVIPRLKYKNFPGCPSVTSDTVIVKIYGRVIGFLLVNFYLVCCRPQLFRRKKSSN